MKKGQWKTAERRQAYSTRVVDHSSKLAHHICPLSFETGSHLFTSQRRRDGLWSHVASSNRNLWYLPRTRHLKEKFQGLSKHKWNVSQLRARNHRPILPTTVELWVVCWHIPHFPPSHRAGYFWRLINHGIYGSNFVLNPHRMIPPLRTHRLPLFGERKWKSIKKQSRPCEIILWPPEKLVTTNVLLIESPKAVCRPCRIYRFDEV